MDPENVYHKRGQSTCEIYVIDKHLTDAIEAVVNKDENIDDDYVKLGVH